MGNIEIEESKNAYNCHLYFYCNLLPKCSDIFSFCLILKNTCFHGYNRPKTNEVLSLSVATCYAQLMCIIRVRVAKCEDKREASSIQMLSVKRLTSCFEMT